MDPAGLSRPEHDQRTGHLEGVRRAAMSLGLGGALVVLGLCLPLVGLVLLLRPDLTAVTWHSPALHFVVFLLVGGLAASLSVVAGEAARLRGDARISEMGGRGYVVYAAVGDTVNVAARLQAAAPVGGVLVGGRTAELMGDDAPLAPVPELRVKGKAEPVTAHLLTLPVPRAEPRSGAVPHRRPR